MPLVAKRKVAETWREAISQRGGARAAICLARFDHLVAEGREEGEAAYRTLEAEGLLWVADEPGSAAAPLASSDDVPAV